MVDKNKRTASTVRLNPYLLGDKDGLNNRSNDSKKQNLAKRIILKKNNQNNLPIYKRFEYRIIDFINTSGYRMMQKKLRDDVYRDLRKPLSEIKSILNESLFGEKYKTKKKNTLSEPIHIIIPLTDLKEGLENEQASPELTRKWIKKIQASWDDVDGGEL